MAKTIITAEPGTAWIDIEREFDAPRELVYRAYTDPDLLARWMGPDNESFTVERYDLHDGGRWRYASHGPDGAEYGFHGVFHGEPSVDGIVQTFEFEGYPGHVSLERVRFEDAGDNRTRVVSRSVYQSLEDRDGMVASGMAEGINSGYDKLDLLLNELRVAR